MRYEIIHEVTSGKLADILNLKILGNRDQIIKRVGILEDTGSNVLKFSKNKTNTKIEGILIGPNDCKAESLILSDNPRLDFCLALTNLLDLGILVQVDLPRKIHESAKIAESAIIHSGVCIGRNSLIEDNVVIHHGTVIGDNSIIRSNSVIGAQGWGFEKNQNNRWIRFPHLGSVKIGNNVEVGALTAICVGTVKDTIIDDGVKIDNLCHISHNCYIGENSILTACTEVSGSVSIGKNVWMGPNSSVVQKITINDNAMVGIGSVVIRDIEKGHTVAGVPARVIKKES